MSLAEVKKIDLRKNAIASKYHWGKLIPNENDFIIKPLTYNMINTLFNQGVRGAWYQPLNKWVSVAWLKKNNYGNIADRIIFLISIYGENKRFIIIERKSNGNLLLCYLPTDWIANILTEW